MKPLETLEHVARLVTQDTGIEFTVERVPRGIRVLIAGSYHGNLFVEDSVMGTPEYRAASYIEGVRIGWKLAKKEIPA